MRSEPNSFHQIIFERHIELRNTGVALPPWHDREAARSIRRDSWRSEPIMARPPSLSTSSESLDIRTTAGHVGSFTMVYQRHSDPASAKYLTFAGVAAWR